MPYKLPSWVLWPLLLILGCGNPVPRLIETPRVIAAPNPPQGNGPGQNGPPAGAPPRDLRAPQATDPATKERSQNIVAEMIARGRFDGANISNIGLSAKDLYGQKGPNGKTLLHGDIDQHMEQKVIDDLKALAKADLHEILATTDDSGLSVADNLINKFVAGGFKNDFINLMGPEELRHIKPNILQALVEKDWSITSSLKPADNTSQEILTRFTDKQFAKFVISKDTSDVLAQEVMNIFDKNRKKAILKALVPGTGTSFFQRLNLNLLSLEPDILNGFAKTNSETMLKALDNDALNKLLKQESEAGTALVKKYPAEIINRLKESKDIHPTHLSELAKNAPAEYVNTFGTDTSNLSGEAQAKVAEVSAAKKKKAQQAATDNIVKTWKGVDHKKMTSEQKASFRSSLNGLSETNMWEINLFIPGILVANLEPTELNNLQGPILDHLIGDDNQRNRDFLEKLDAIGMNKLSDEKFSALLKSLSYQNKQNFLARIGVSGIKQLVAKRYQLLNE